GRRDGVDAAQSWDAGVINSPPWSFDYLGASGLVQSPPRRSQRIRHQSRGSHIHVGAERIVLDELAARLDHVAHQLGKDVVGLVDLLDLHLQQLARIGIERGLPKLFRVHFAETFIALQLYALASGAGHGLEQGDRPVNYRVGVLATQAAWLWIGFLQLGGVIVELARVGGAKQRVIDN